MPDYVCDLDAPLETVWAFHQDPNSYLSVTPPHLVARLEGDVPPMGPGAVYLLRFRRFGIRMSLETEIIEYDPPRSFVNRQVAPRGPLRAWEHQHLFLPLGPNRTRMIDRVSYKMPLGILGVLADEIFVRRELENLFAYQHKRTREALAEPPSNKP